MRHAFQPASTTTPMKAVTDLRAQLEGFASRYAAIRVTQGCPAETLLACFAQMGLATEKGDEDAFAEVDRQLHREVVLLADVPALEQSWLVAFQAQNTFRLETLSQCWPDLSMLFESHRPLVEAVVSGRPDEAEEAALAHLDAVWFRLAQATHDQSLSHGPLSKACAYLAFHFHQPLKLENLAEIAGCSSGHLARLFREEQGLSFSSYVIELRLQKAAQLLQRTDSTIHQIAKRVGYLDPSRFATHFRRRFGLTPSGFQHTFSLPNRSGDRSNETSSHRPTLL